MRVGQLLAEYKYRNAITNEELGRRLGCTKEHIWGVINGKCKGSKGLQYRICDMIGLLPEFLKHLEEEKVKRKRKTKAPCDQKAGAEITVICQSKEELSPNIPHSSCCCND